MRNCAWRHFCSLPLVAPWATLKAFSEAAARSNVADDIEWGVLFRQALPTHERYYWEDVMVKGQVNFILFMVAILALACGCTFPKQQPTTPVAASVLSPTAVDDSEQPSTATPPPGGDIAIGPGEMITYPDEYLAYQKYLDVIGGRPGKPDMAVLEATVISLLRSEICPYQEESCRIEPYPSDWGMVRVDKILEYSSYGDPALESPVDQPSEGVPATAKTAPQHVGSQPQSKAAPFEALKEGQEVQTLFLHTTRPAKVMCVTTGTLDTQEEGQPSEEAAQETTEHRVQPGETVFDPIPREANYYLFAARTGECVDTSDRVLPGLEVGSRFRAKVRYDGTLYVEEYAIVP